MKLHPKSALDRVPAGHVDSLTLTKAQIFFVCVETWVFTKVSPCPELFSAGVFKNGATTEPGPECTQLKAELSLRILIKTQTDFVKLFLWCQCITLCFPQMYDFLGGVAPDINIHTVYVFKTLFKICKGCIVWSMRDVKPVLQGC